MKMQERRLTMTINNYQENYLYSEDYNPTDTCDSTCFNSHDCDHVERATERFLREYYQPTKNYCLRHQMSKCTECKEDHG